MNEIIVSSLENNIQIISDDPRIIIQQSDNTDYSYIIDWNCRQGLPGPKGEPGLIGQQGEQGQQGIQGVPGAGVEQLSAVTIAAGNNSLIDSYPLTLGQGVRWAIIVADTVAGLCRTFDASGTLTSAGVNHIIFGGVGDRILFNVTSSYQNGNILLSIQNQHANNIIVSVVRIFIYNH